MLFSNLRIFCYLDKEFLENNHARKVLLYPVSFFSMAGARYVSAWFQLPFVRNFATFLEFWLICTYVLICFIVSLCQVFVLLIFAFKTAYVSITFFAFIRSLMLCMFVTSLFPMSRLKPIKATSSKFTMVNWWSQKDVWINSTSMSWLNIPDLNRCDYKIIGHRALLISSLCLPKAMASLM